MVGRDVVRQDSEWTHALEAARIGGERAHALGVPIGRAANVGRLRSPVVKGIGLAGVAGGEHRFVDFPELLRFHGRCDDRVDLFIARPQVLETDLPAIDEPQHILLDVKTHRARDRIGDHQRRRGEEGLLCIGVDAAIEIAVP